MIVKYLKGPVTEGNPIELHICSRHLRMRKSYFVDTSKVNEEWHSCCVILSDGITICNNWVTEITVARYIEAGDELLEYQGLFKRFYRSHSVTPLQFYNFYRFSVLVYSQIIGDVFDRNTPRPFTESFYDSAKRQIRANFEYFLEKFNNFFDHDMKNLKPMGLNLEHFPKEMLLTNQEMEGFDEYEKDILQRLCIYLYCFKDSRLLTKKYQVRTVFGLLVGFFENCFFDIKFVKEKSTGRLHELLEQHCLENFEQHCDDFYNKTLDGQWSESPLAVFEL